MKKWKFIFFSEAEQNLYLHKRSSKMSSGSNEKISAIYWWWNEDVCWNKSLHFSHALFTAKTGFHFSRCFFSEEFLSEQDKRLLCFYNLTIVAAHVICSLGSPEAGRGPRAITQGRYYWHHREQMAGQTFFSWVKCWDDCVRLELHWVCLIHSSLPFCWPHSSPNLIQHTHGFVLSSSLV